MYVFNDLQSTGDANTSPDYSVLGSNPRLAASAMGRIRRGTFDEAGHSYSPFFFDTLSQARVRQISLAHSPSHSEFGGTGLCMSCFSSSIEYSVWLTSFQETIVYLLDEALELWSAILMQTPTPASPEILALIPALFPILEAATDSAPQALQIAESYIFLAPQEILSDRIRLPLLASFEALLNSTTKQRLGIVPRLVELMIRGAEAVDGGSENTYNIITRSLLDSSFLPALLEGLYSAHESSQTTGPNRKQSSVYGVVETDYFSVLARLALAHPKIFASAVSTATGTSDEQALTWLLTEWFFHYDNIGSANQKKLHALALTQLLTLNGPDSQPPAYILTHLQSYLNVWADIITELAEGAEGDPDDPRSGDHLIYWNNAETGTSEEHEAPENIRRREWDNADVLHKINIRDFVRERLRSLIVGCGGEQRFQEDWLLNVDREVVAAFGALGLF